MSGSTQLPDDQELRELSRLVDGYPVSCSELLWTAQRAQMTQALLDCLRQYPKDRVFRSPSELLSVQAELALLDNSLQSMPVERLHNPQD